MSDVDAESKLRAKSRLESLISKLTAQKQNCKKKQATKKNGAIKLLIRKRAEREANTETLSRPAAVPAENNNNRPTKQFKCPSCSASFKNRNKVKCHFIALHLPTDSRRFACDLCDKKYVQASHLRVHRISHDRSTRKHVCVHCKAHFAVKNALDRHQVICKRHQARFRFACAECTERATSQEALNEHMRKTHFRVSEDSFLTCELCCRPFGTQVSLGEHELIHNIERPFQCRFCWRRFAAESNCRRHETLHWEGHDQVTDHRAHSDYQNTDFNGVTQPASSGPLPKEHRPDLVNGDNYSLLECVTCAAQFFNQHTLATHVQTVHFEILDRPFSCTQAGCDKRFKRADHLRQHLKTHSVAQPFACELCEQKFKRDSSRKRHLKVCHPEVN